jgi:uncharacterized protein
MTPKKSILALCLLIPAPSLGVAAASICFPNSMLGTALFAFSKLWLLALPVLWHLFVDKEKLQKPTLKAAGLVPGFGLGLLLSAAIYAAYSLFGGTLLDPSLMSREVEKIGLDSPLLYLAGAAYWILVNSVLEEYVWRWFVVKQSETFLPKWGAIALSALAFTIHHVVILSLYFEWPAVLLCSAGVFVGGAVWSALYSRYRSIWPGYLSHAVVDGIIFYIGAQVVFAAA